MTAVDLEFVDSNILVYAHDAHSSVRPERERARQLLDRLWETGTGRISTQVLQEFYVTVTRKPPQQMSWQPFACITRVSCRIGMRSSS
jgi:predicted nucleic acid-binding protein